MTRLTRAFSVSFTTGPFGPSRIRLFEASPYRVGFEGPEYRSQSVTVLLLHLSYSTMRFRIFMSQSPQASHRTVFDTLASHGSSIAGKHACLPSSSRGSSRFRLAKTQLRWPLPSPSRAEEFHREPLTEPYLTLSRHTARPPQEDLSAFHRII